MSWAVRVYCTDCMQIGDTMGCFDGGKENYDERFATKEEAEAFMAKLDDEDTCVLWEREVFEVKP
jgi:hypothetical protein